MTAQAVASPCRPIAGALAIRFRLTPKGGRDAVEGLTDTADGPAIKARVRAAPEDGEANAALCTLVAKWIGVAKQDVTLLSGHKSRLKTVAVAGDAGSLMQVLQSLLEQQPDTGRTNT